MTLTAEDIRLILLLVDLTDKLPAEVLAECAQEIEEAWALAERLRALEPNAGVE